MMEPKLQNKEEIQTKIRKFSQSAKWKNFLTFLVFIAIAFVFWTLQYFQQRFEVEVSIPVYYVEIPNETTITNQLPDKINIHLIDKGTALFNSFLRKNPKAIEISLKDILPQKNTFVIDQTTIYRLVHDRLTGTSDVKSISPEKIEINYAPLSQKDLPVRLDGVLLPAPGYILHDSIIVSPGIITAYGDKNSLDTINYISTVPVDIKDISKDMERSLDLAIPQQLRLSANKVKLTIQVEEYTEKIIELPITCANLPENRIIRFFPSTAKVYIQTGLSHYAGLKASDFAIDLNYNELIQNSSTSSISLKLSQFPSEILNYRIEPEIIEFLIEKKS